MKRAPDVQYFVEKCIRRGAATYTEIREVSEQYGTDYADALAEELSVTGVQLVDERDIAISPQTNVLMNDLRLVELVSLALRLPVAPKQGLCTFAKLYQCRNSVSHRQDQYWSLTCFSTH